eukprot:SAG11_NODE_429_length_9534_cov_14.689242_10_plen_76_part_00
MKMDPKTIAKDRKRCTKILKKVLKEKEGEENDDAQAWKDGRNCKSLRCILLLRKGYALLLAPNRLLAHDLIFVCP